MASNAENVSIWWRHYEIRHSISRGYYVWVTLSTITGPLWGESPVPVNLRRHNAQVPSLSMYLPYEHWNGRKFHHPFWQLSVQPARNIKKMTKFQLKWFPCLIVHTTTFYSPAHTHVHTILSPSKNAMNRLWHQFHEKRRSGYFV